MVGRPSKPSLFLEGGGLRAQGEANKIQSTSPVGSSAVENFQSALGGHNSEAVTTPRLEEARTLKNPAIIDGFAAFSMDDMA